MSNYYLPFACGVSLVSLIISLWLWWDARAIHKLRKNFAESNVDLESILNTIYQNLNALEKQTIESERVLGEIKESAKFSVQKMGIVRFNPFGDSGGNLSFSLALLNGHSTGVVITSMHGRQQNRIYTKRVEHGKAESTLTEEEQKAIELSDQK